jgi:hypothetical protein
VWALDVNGDLSYPRPLATRWTRRGAERFVDGWYIPEPIPGKPLYSLVIERVP